MTLAYDLKKMYWMQQRDPLPPEYRRVEYIATANAVTSSYIDTGVFGSSDMRWVLDMRLLQLSNTRLGVSGQTGADARFAIGKAYSSMSTHPNFYCGLGDANFDSAVPLDTARHLFVLDALTKTFSIDASSFSVPMTVFSDTPGIYGMAIFARNGVTSGYDSTTQTFGACYGTRIWRNGVLVMDAAPAVRISDSKPGLYDLCRSICPLTNSPFYVNAGTGDFTWAELS